MKIICVEAHAVATQIAPLVLPVLQRNAPYMAHLHSKNAANRPRNAHRPTMVLLSDAFALGADIGAERIKEMDAQGIQMQAVSYSTPVQLLPADQAAPLVRAANDRLANAIKEHPKRLSGFAALPWQDTRAAVDELYRSVNELGLKGVLVMGRPVDSFLDDPRYLPVLRTLQELKVPLYVHPFYPVTDVQQAYYSGFNPEVTAEFSLSGWGWHHEAGIHVLRLLLSGIFEKLPDLQLISGHWGEMVPFYLQRLDESMPSSVTGLSASISEIYKNNVWITPSGMFDLPQFEFVHKVIGADRIIWSTDYPFFTMDGTREFLMNLPVSEEDRQKIAFLNAEKVLRL